MFIKKLLTSLISSSLILLLLITPIKTYAANILDKFSELDNAGLLLINSQQQVLISSHADKSFIPASTTKLITAWLALKHWGENYHFRTLFYIDNSSNTLWVKGSGDPYLVSEEITRIAKNLKNLGLQKIDRIGLDTSFFQAQLRVSGAGRSDNPYDAIPSAIAANFNTLAIKKVHGKIYSVEPQTPVTAFARSLAHQVKSSDYRINTGQSSKNAERYFAELLREFLRQQGIEVGKKIIWGKSPQQKPYYSHSNSKNLGEMIRPMLKYSTNFIANQLVLTMSAENNQRPANFRDVQTYMETKLTQQFNWKNFTLKEGAGLSRENRISPQQLVQLLEDFKPWKHLLPEVETHVYAKSGTLNKVSTLAGYIVHNQQWQAFALMMNQSVPYKLRNRIARELVKLQN